MEQVWTPSTVGGRPSHCGYGLEEMKADGRQSTVLMQHRHGNRVDMEYPQLLRELECEQNNSIRYQKGKTKFVDSFTRCQPRCNPIFEAQYNKTPTTITTKKEAKQTHLDNNVYGEGNGSCTLNLFSAKTQPPSRLPIPSEQLKTFIQKKQNMMVFQNKIWEPLLAFMDEILYTIY